MTKANGRNQSIDSLKGAAILAVVFLHLPSSESTQAYTWQLLEILGRFAVPCFFMISGYFFCLSWQRAEQKRKVLEKSTGRIIPIFLFWALFYALIPPFVDGGNAWQHIQGIMRNPHSFILSGNVYHLWFLSSLLQGLSILWLFLKMQRLHTGLLLGCALFITSLICGTYATTPLGHPISFDMKNGPFFSTIFVIFGAMIAQNHLKFNTYQAIGLAILGYLLCIAEVAVLHRCFAVPFEGHSVMIGTIPLTVGLVNLALHGKFPFSSLAYFGKYSLGIYVIHPWIIEILRTQDNHIRAMSPFLVLILASLISLLLTLVLAKVPYAKRLIA